MNEQDLLKTVMETESWEDVIYNIVSIEGLDPWDIDIIKLTDSFLKYIESIKMLDFRIPAKIVFVAAILLKLKVETLFPQEDEEIQIPEENIDEYKLIREKLSEISLKPPLNRITTRAVTLEELVSALKKAMEVKERKEQRRRILGKNIVNNINLTEEDIEIRIKKLMDEIDTLLKKLKTNKVEFSKIVHDWRRDEIVKHFLPLLYLSTRGNVITEQEDFFKEIYIFKKN